MRIISRVTVAGAIGVATLFILATMTPGSSFASARAGDNIGRLPDDTGSTDQFAPALNREFQDFNDPARSKLITADGEAPVQVNVVFHVLSGPASEGNVSDAVLNEQTSVLNDAYRSAGIHLNIAEVRRYPNSPYFAAGCFPTTVEGIRMKSELAVDPARFVNIYICKLLLPYIAGYGTLPDEFPESDSRHGIVIDYETLPGSAAPLNLGNTLVHELGHYFGLLHTFQGGCAEPGDGVADTPAEAVPAHGCPVDRDTCPQEGLDPVTNFMDYSDDACMDGFTPLQDSRMRVLIASYRPSLAVSGFAIGPGMTGNWYDPHQSGHGFSIEILPDNQMLAEWFVFAPNGGQTWIVGMGPITGDTATLQGYQVVGPGARFPPNFDPTQRQNQPWGTLVFRFADCNNGQVSWQPTAAGYSSGSMAVTRLTMPAGLTCP